MLSVEFSFSFFSLPFVLTIGCASGLFLSRNKCVTNCPDGTFPFVSAKSSCLKCHYTCRTCVTANNCSSCFTDAELHRDRCYAKELVKEVMDLEKWYTAVSVLFLCLCFLIFVLVVYILTEKNQTVCRWAGDSRGTFALRDRRPQTQVLKLDSKKIKRPVVLNYSDDYNSEEDLWLYQSTQLCESIFEFSIRFRTFLIKNRKALSIQL